MSTHDQHVRNYVELDAAGFVSGRAHEGVALRDCDVSGRSIDEATFEDSSLSNVNGSNGKFSELALIDLVVDECDFANAHWPKAECTRVAIRKSRFTGLNATEARLRNTSFQACKLNVAIFHDVHFNDCVFDKCDLREADFQGAKINKVVFRDCDLRNVRFSGASLRGLDLRGSHIAGLHIDSDKLAGTVVDPSQLIELSTLLGLVVKDVNQDGD